MAGRIFVVVGAKGGTGREIVRALAALPADTVAEVRAVVRDPATVTAEHALAPHLVDDRVTLVAGDCTQSETLAAPFAGAHVVFFAAAGKGYANARAVDQVGLGATGVAAKEAGVARVVAVTAQLVHPSNRFNLIRGILNTINTGLFHKRGMMDMKYEGEQLLRGSGADYTIVRPGQLGDGTDEATGEVVAAQCNGSLQRGGKLTRAATAAVCVAAAMSPLTKNVCFEVSGNSGAAFQGGEALPRLFEGLIPAGEEGGL